MESSKIIAGGQSGEYFKGVVLDRLNDALIYGAITFVTITAIISIMLCVRCVYYHLKAHATPLIPLLMILANVCLTFFFYRLTLLNLKTAEILTLGVIFLIGEGLMAKVAEELGDYL